MANEHDNKQFTYPFYRTIPCVAHSRFFLFIIQIFLPNLAGCLNLKVKLKFNVLVRDLNPDILGSKYANHYSTEEYLV